MVGPILLDVTRDIAADAGIDTDITDEMLTEEVRNRAAGELTTACEDQPGARLPTVFRDLMTTRVDDIFDRVGDELEP
jgi:hypothetical protein